MHENASDALDTIYVSYIHNSNSTFYVLKILHPRLVMTCTIVCSLASLEPRESEGGYSSSISVHVCAPCTEVSGATVKGGGDHIASCPKYANSTLSRRTSTQQL